MSPTICATAVGIPAFAIGARLSPNQSQDSLTHRGGPAYGEGGDGGGPATLTCPRFRGETTAPDRTLPAARSPASARSLERYASRRGRRDGARDLDAAT